MQLDKCGRFTAQKCPKFAFLISSIDNEIAEDWSSQYFQGHFTVKIFLRNLLVKKP